MRRGESEKSPTIATLRRAGPLSAVIVLQPDHIVQFRGGDFQRRTTRASARKRWITPGRTLNPSPVATLFTWISGQHRFRGSGSPPSRRSSHPSLRDTDGSMNALLRFAESFRRTAPCEQKSTRRPMAFQPIGTGLMETVWAGAGLLMDSTFPLTGEIQTLKVARTLRRESGIQ